jgi:osmotically-inducible protein OsmY
MVTIFRAKYDDEKLAAHAEKALSEEPTVDLTHIIIDSNKGVVTLSGRLNSAFARRNALAAVEKMFALRSLKYARIVDEIEVR